MGELWDTIVKRANEGKSMDDLATGNPIKLISQYYLWGTMRQWTIKWIKDPLRKALTTGKSFAQVMKTLAIIAERIPVITRQNSLSKRTHNLIKIQNKFFQYQNDGWVDGSEDRLGRTRMWRHAWKLGIFEVDHDEHYQGALDWIVEEIFKLVLTGEWVSRPEGNPLPITWKEPQPYGGKWTIIYAIQKNREKIIDCLPPEWQWLKGGKYETERK